MRVKSSMREPSPTLIASGFSSSAPEKTWTPSPTDARRSMNSCDLYTPGAYPPVARTRTSHDPIRLVVAHLEEQRQVEHALGRPLGGRADDTLRERGVLGDRLLVGRDRVQGARLDIGLRELGRDAIALVDEHGVAEARGAPPRLWPTTSTRGCGASAAS